MKKMTYFSWELIIGNYYNEDLGSLKVAGIK